MRGRCARVEATERGRRHRKIVGPKALFARAKAPHRQHGTPKTPEDLANHNCIVFNGMENWVFKSPRGKFSVRVGGNLSSNTAETILSAVEAGVGTGMFYRASKTCEWQGPG